MEIGLLISLVTASIQDAKKMQIDEYAWLPALISAYSHLEISLIPPLVISLSLMLYYLDILGGADAKALAFISTFSNVGIPVLIYTILACCSIAIPFAIRGISSKSKLSMSFPLIPLITLLYYLSSIKYNGISLVP